MSKFIQILLMFSVSWAIGLQALNITTDAREMSLSGGGIAIDFNPDVNPASVFSINNRYLGFSQTFWFVGVSGQKVKLSWNQESPKLFAIEKLGLEDIDLRDEIPNDEPLGEFGVRWVSAGITAGYQLSDLDFGISVKGSYYRLYNYSSFVFTTDIGFIKKFNTSISSGFVLKNLGYSYSDSLRDHLPTTIGIGISVNEAFISSTFFVDAMYSLKHGLVGYTGIVVPIQKLQIISALEYSPKSEHFAISSGFSFSYRKWGVNYSVKLHNNEVLGIPHSVDIILYF